MLTTYVLGSLALIVKPGPDLMCLLATALSEGRMRAIALMLGQIFGCWVWILLLSLGVASFFTGHPAVMTVIQIVGICYIAYLAFLSFREVFQSSDEGQRSKVKGQGEGMVGVDSWSGSKEGLTRQRPTTDNQQPATNNRQPANLRYFGRGMAMAMSNPLTILFFLAFLPHFTRAGSSLSPAFQTLLLGTLFCALVPVVDLPVVFTANAFRSRLIGKAKFASALKLLSGLMLAAVVVVLACSVA